MATMTSDTLYANHQPSTAPTFTPHQRPYVEERWKQFEPWMTMAARKELDPAAKLYEFKCLHARRLHTLLRARISWATIKDYRLDDPVITEDGFRVALAAAVERRRSRMNRVKGRGKKYTRKRKLDKTRIV
jgi:hypothetical protein